MASTKSPGHVAIAGEKPDGTIEARGFYPDHAAAKGLEIGLGDVPGVVKDDRPLFDRAMAGESGTSIRTYSVTVGQHDAALRTMNGFAQSNAYNLYGCSCVHAAAASLQAAGITDVDVGGFAPTPADVHFQNVFGR